MTSRGSKDVYRHSDKFAHVINRCMVHSNLQRDRDNFLDSLQFDSLVGPSKMGWGGGQHTFVLLPLFQEGQLSVTGESMCTKYWLTA